MRKMDYTITGIEYESTKSPEWDETIVLDMTGARIGAHYVSGAIIDYLYKRFLSPTYLNKVSELYNCKSLIIIRNLEKARLDDLMNIGVMIMFGDDCSRLISESPRWKIVIEKCIAMEE